MFIKNSNNTLGYKGGIEQCDELTPLNTQIS